MNVSAILGAYLPYAQQFATEMKVGRERKEKELRERWKNLQNLPRKRKKREKKDILTTWAIIHWEPIEGFDSFLEMFSY